MKMQSNLILHNLRSVSGLTASSSSHDSSGWEISNTEPISSYTPPLILVQLHSLRIFNFDLNIVVMLLIRVVWFTLLLACSIADYTLYVKVVRGTGGMCTALLVNNDSSLMMLKGSVQNTTIFGRVNNFRPISFDNIMRVESYILRLELFWTERKYLFLLNHISIGGI